MQINTNNGAGVVENKNPGRLNSKTCFLLFIETFQLLTHKKPNLQSCTWSSSDINQKLILRFKVERKLFTYLLPLSAGKSNREKVRCDYIFTVLTPRSRKLKRKLNFGSLQCRQEVNQSNNFFISRKSPEDRVSLGFDEKLRCDSSVGYHLPLRQGIGSLNKINVTNRVAAMERPKETRFSLLIISCTVSLHALKSMSVAPSNLSPVAMSGPEAARRQQGIDFQWITFPLNQIKPESRVQH